MKIQRRIADTGSYGDRRALSDITYIVIQTIENKPISHYNIVKGEVIQRIPDDYISDAVNGRKLCSKGILHGICTKYNCISIGLPEKLSTDDENACIKLIMTIKQRYKIEDSNVIRQMDVTGEPNPMIWQDNNKWAKFIQRLKDLYK